MIIILVSNLVFYTQSTSTVISGRIIILIIMKKEESHTKSAAYKLQTQSHQYRHILKICLLTMSEQTDKRVAKQREKTTLRQLNGIIFCIIIKHVKKSIQQEKTKILKRR